MCLGGGSGRRKGLKIPRGQPHTGSIPVPGTIKSMVLGAHTFGIKYYQAFQAFPSFKPLPVNELRAYPLRLIALPVPVLCPNCAHFANLLFLGDTLSRTPALTMFLTAVLLKSWNSLPSSFASLQAVSHDPLKSFILWPSSPKNTHGQLGNLASLKGLFIIFLKNQPNPFPQKRR